MPQNFILNIFSDLFALLISFLFNFSYFSRFFLFQHSYPCRRSSNSLFLFTLSLPPTGSSLMPPPPNQQASYPSAFATSSPPDDSGAGDATPFYMDEAQRLKHEADKENDRERQAMKYLQAVLYFSLNANFHEQNGDKSSAFTIYKETLNLIK